ncbi:MAG: hypothetical protein IIW56_01015 [Oscillospiraceae bacterium]|nr:hypothetical protein [Oscillospiraceae bacterium]
MKNKRPMTKGEAWFLLIVGLIMGTVFTFGMQYWNTPIKQKESIHTTAIYESYATQQERGHVAEIIIQFEDHAQLYIDGVCINDNLLNSIDNLTPGIELSMIVHPNSNTIMELNADNQVLLEFQNTSEKLSGEATGFMGLGLFCYVLSMCGLIRLLSQKRR